MVRFSGPEALRIVCQLVRLKGEPQPRHATLGELLGPEGEMPGEMPGETVDQVVVTYFRKPHSYTAEDVVEVSCHGAPVLLRFLLKRATAQGARLAEPGEFTMRAFLNGRLDLAQAEAVRDLIEAQTLYQARVAAQQMGGAVARRLAPVKKELVDLIALLEAGIDFAEDDVSILPSPEILERIRRVRAGLETYAETFRFGRVVQEGLTLAILGRPNVGKSSLFNRLVERDRAIVTAVPGTTRDLVTEVVNLEGIPVKLVDTAGIRHARDEAESIGVRKSYEALADSDLALVVLDSSAGLAAEDDELLERSRAAGTALVVWNKVDLGPPPHELKLVKLELKPGDDGASPPAGPWPIGSWMVSALTGQGVPELRRAIVESALPGLDGSRETGFLTNIRHERLLRDSLEALGAARRAVEQNVPHEMLLLDLYNALRPLDAITGQTTIEDILNQIFSTFCVGK